MGNLAFTRSGAGAPLVLVHPLGSSRRVWDPVVPALSDSFDVLAVDLPGFGDSPPLPPDVEPTPEVLAAAVGTLLDDLAIPVPHVAGNSLGGWVALELAQLRPVASLTLLSPAGLWTGGAPLYCRASLRASRWLCRHAAGLLARLVDHRAGRILVLGQTHGRPARMTPAQARAAITDLGTPPGFDATLRATATRRFRSRASIDAPVTVAFGTRDYVLPRGRYRRLDELPPGTRLEALPRCGHLPVADDPPAVAALITRALRVRPGSPEQAATRAGT
jgi:pimeloyl-ACP methyl ester carboxylesterase